MLDTVYQFPLVVDNEEGSIYVDVTRSNSRCGFLSNYWIQVYNYSCSEFSGNLEVNISEKSEYAELITGGELTNSHTITYDLADLPIGSISTFRAAVRMPSFEFLGEIIKDSYVLSDDLGDQIQLDTSSFILGCAYDPNDKSIQPDRSEDYGGQYILNEDLEYLIRFENVGNDSAINIKVIDNISEYLDLETLEIIATSHNYRYTLNQSTRVLTVYFDNIYLPDNKTNEPESHGFIKYSIRPHENLDEFTNIDNEARIYFDFNPPILTNKTQSTFVSDLSLLTSVKTVMDKAYSIIYPNPTNDFLSIELSDDQKINSIQIFRINGELVKEFRDVKEKLKIAELNSGVYLIHIKTNSKTYNNKFVKL